MTKVHYAKIDLDGDIPCYEFGTIEQVRDFVQSILNKHPKKEAEFVYLLVIQDDVIVTENCQFIEEIFDGNLNSVYPFYEGDAVSIHEYSSYEEAYNIALTYKEAVSPICYLP
jgi:hypothetical protein